MSLWDRLNQIEIETLDIGDRIGNTEYIDFIREEEMGNSSIKRGIDIYDRPFVVIRLKDNNNNYYMQTFFKRYNNSELIMGCGHYGNHWMHTEGGMNQRQIDLLIQLIENRTVTIPIEEIHNNSYRFNGIIQSEIIFTLV